MLFRTRFLRTLMLAVAVTAVLTTAPSARAGSVVELSDGGTSYVAVYPNVFTGPKQVPFQIAATLVMRNTDPSYPITLTVVDYYDSKGKKIRSYITEPLEIAPNAGVYYYTQGSGKLAEGGATFIVTWQAGRKVNRPIIEAVMAGSQSGSAISYRTLGQDITGHDE